MILKSLLGWWDRRYSEVRMDDIKAALQKAGDGGMTLEELVLACQSSRSQVDRALRKLRERGLVEKDGVRWRTRA